MADSQRPDFPSRAKIAEKLIGSVNLTQTPLVTVTPLDIIFVAINLCDILRDSLRVFLVSVKGVLQKGLNIIIGFSSCTPLFKNSKRFPIHTLP